MKKTGEFLRKAREDKGLSVHEIGLSLKINPKILKQIEEGDKDNLPAKTFLRGFVQSYALFLKIDPNEVLRIFSDEMGTTKPHQISLTSGPQIKGNSIEVEEPENKDDLGIKRNTGHSFNKEKFEFKNVGVGIVVFILLLSLIAVRKVVEKYQKEAEVDLAKTEENLKSANKLELPQAPAPVTPISEADSKQPLSGQPVAGQPSGAQLHPAAPNPAPTTIPEVKAPNALPNAGTLPSINSAEPPKPTNKIPPPTPVTTNPTNTVAPTTAASQQNSNLPTTAKPSLVAPSGTLAPTSVPAPKPVVAAPATANSPGNTVKPVSPTTNATASVPTTAATKPIEDSKKPTVATGTDSTTTAATPAPKEEPKKPRNIELVIEAFESVEIEMIQSSGKTEKIKMSPSQVQTFKTVSGVKLNISNGGAVNLSVNGKDLGVPGDLGKPKKVSF